MLSLTLSAAAARWRSTSNGGVWMMVVVLVLLTVLLGMKLVCSGSVVLLSNRRQVDPARRRPHDATQPVPYMLAAHQQA